MYLCVCQRYLCDPLHARTRVDRAVLVQQTTVPMVSVLAQTHVACNEKIGKLLPQQLDGENNRTFGIIGRRAAHILYHTQKIRLR